MPDFAKGHIGAGLTSFAAMTTTGYFEPMIVMLMAQFAIYVAAEPAAEIESGLVDTVLARPLPRHWLVTRSMIVMAIGTVTLMIAMGAATSAGCASSRRRESAGPSRVSSCCSSSIYSR